MLSGFSQSKCLDTEWLPGMRLRHFSTTCAVRVENCGGWWLSSCHRLSGRALAAQARCPEFNSQRLPAFSLSSIFASQHLLFQQEARVLSIM